MLDKKRSVSQVHANTEFLFFMVTNVVTAYSAEGTVIGTGFIANFTMPDSSTPVTVLVTNHHMIHNLNEALESTFQFSYMRSHSDDTPRAIFGRELIPQNIQRFHTCKEYEGVSITVIMTSLP